MEHFDEHTLTLYVLGARSVGPEANAIERHLAECQGCRGMVEEIRALHAGVQQELSATDQAEARHSEDLIRVRRGLTRRPDAPSVDILPGVAGVGRHIIRYARRHPVAAGGTLVTFSFLAFFLGRGIWDTVQPARLGQPSQLRMNEMGTALVVFDKNSSRLWDLPVRDGTALLHEEAKWRIALTVIADLRGDGNMEIVTSAPSRADLGWADNVLRVYDNKGSVLFTRALGDRVTYRGSEYPIYFSLGGIVMVSSDHLPGRQIMVGATNHRSPFVLSRISATGEILGEYWHFGWLTGLRTVRLKGDEHDLVVACGANESGDKSDSSFACIVVLDPAGVNGKTESTLSPGFGFPASEAERYYIRVALPRLPIPPDSSTGKESFSVSPAVAQDGSLVFLCQSKRIDGIPIFSYTFDNRMHIQNLFLDDTSLQILRTRYLTDKTPAGIERFMEKVRAGVRYWDGHSWKNEPTEVHSKTSP